MKYLILSILTISTMFLSAQNLQLHYDFGKAKNYNTSMNREYFTSTFEFFKSDSLGSTFMFVDVDYDKPNGGASMAYFEISRKFTLLKKCGLSLQIEYDDGTPVYINKAWLGGFSYPIRFGSVTINASLLYRASYGAKSTDGQITFVWYQPLFKSKMLFTGFMDIWSMDKFSGSGKDVVLLTEPQLWYVLTKHLSVGSEVEISRNFFTFDGDFEVMPTIAVKWNF